ncbi:hypothetical protein LEP1GSC196_3385 [Leptospira meyeri serovar Semaranga str. Veldrot Semarang 173]|nr:hypothetical protein LEP1GSC196_3385 [Leptospira meyeri serovar Semaranga str. Veldrot Semarang 173]
MFYNANFHYLISLLKNNLSEREKRVESLTRANWTFEHL